MRIIAGTARGRRLAAPKGHGTRPTPDRVREALFSILAAEIDGCAVLDLFAGTGALGLEALSRGARRAVFVEKDRDTARVLERNLEVVDGDCQVLTMPAARALRVLARNGSRFEIAFLDPPYDADLLGPTLADLNARQLVSDLVVCEHRGSDAPPPAPTGWARTETRRFGDVALSFYRQKGVAP